MRPVIGITASYSQAIYVEEYKEPRREHQYLYHSYIRAVWEAGGNPLIIPVGIEPEAGIEALRRIDGLLLPGGVDIDPENYNHPPSPNSTRFDKFKDATELAVLREALRRMMPLFGICRGLQLIAVALTGNLIQDIATEIPWAVNHNFPETDNESRHEISIKQGSAIQRILGAEKADVNSWHHQAVGEIPRDWVVTAETPDGVVECLEYSIDPLIFGVQWHPEAMTDSDPSQLNLFKAFVRSCVQR
jgi:putative glutamine amidotransferase